jgi:hypothetical protein
MSVRKTWALAAVSAGELLSALRFTALLLPFIRISRIAMQYMAKSHRSGAARVL